MGENLGANDMLQRLEVDEEKLESLCNEFQSLLTDDQLEEFSGLDLGQLSTDDIEHEGGSDEVSSDEEFLSPLDGHLAGRVSPVSSLSSSSSETTSSSSTLRSFPSPPNSRSSQGTQEQDQDDTPSPLTAVSLAKVLLSGAIPRLKNIISKHLNDPEDGSPTLEEIREKYDSFLVVTSEAFRRFSVLRQRSENPEP